MLSNIYLIVSTEMLNDLVISGDREMQKGHGREVLRIEGK